MNSLFDSVRIAARVRDDLAKRLDAARSRLRAVDFEREAAERVADETAAALRSALADVAAGAEGIDTSAARAARDASACHAADLRETAAELRDRLGALEREHDAAQKSAARARKELAVALASSREQVLWRTADAFARALRGFHDAATSANHEFYLETGSLGNVVPHEGRAGLLETGAGDNGIVALFKTYGVSETLKVRARPLDERELLACEGDADDSDTDCSSPQAEANCTRQVSP